MSFSKRGKMITIKTKDFVLRPAILADAKNIYEYQKDNDVKANFMSTPKNIKEVEKELRKDFIDRRKSKDKRDGEEWIIEINREAAGQISIYFFDKRNRSKAKLSYWLAKKYRGKGIMAKVLRIVTNYTFKEYKIVRLEGRVRSYNKSSAKVLERCGYKLEGILRKNQKKGNKYVDDLLYAKIK